MNGGRIRYFGNFSGSMAAFFGEGIGVVYGGSAKCLGHLMNETWWSGWIGVFTQDLFLVGGRKGGKRAAASSDAMERGTGTWTKNDRSIDALFVDTLVFFIISQPGNWKV